MTRNASLLFAAALCATPALAQEGDEEAFDLALKEFGYAGGAAWQCATEDEKSALLDQSLRVYTRLTQLFGTDRAFFFSAAFGAGAVDDIASEDCAGYAAAFAEGLSEGGR
jgi:uncharacterized protein YdeI (BOF family)